MAYLGSKKIKVFPSIGRDSTLDADAELMNEGNISNIVRSLCRERKSYVLSKTFSAPFEFVIYGFYFKITDVSTLLEGLSDDKPLYAHIVVNKQSGVYQLLSTINPSPTELKLDQETSVGSGSYEFRGIVFNNSATYTPSEDQDVGNVYTLQLLDSNSKVPVESRLFYRTSEILGSTNTFGSSKYINEYFETISTNITDSLNVGGQSTLNGTVLVGPENSRTIVSGNVITTDNVKTLIIEGTGSDPKLTISGSVKSVGTLDVIGATTISDTLDVVKATTLNNTLTVSKASTTLSDTTINGTLDVIGNAVLGKLTAETTTLGSIDVTGEAKLQGAITASSTLTVSGDTTLNGILIAGNTKLSSLTVSGDTTLNGINPKITGNDLGTSSLR